MAKYADIEEKCRQIITDVRNGVFAPIYLLMGSEPYYPELVCGEIVKNALTETERDFNQSIYYGIDAVVDDVVSEARSYPVMAERRLVILKEAQNVKERDMEPLAQYAAEPMDSTVLVLLLHGASLDKRKSLYKAISKCGVVLESESMRDYEMPQWITSYYKKLGLQIAPDAAALFAEYAGVDIDKIVLETDKLRRSLPEGTVAVTAADIEKNVGISRQFSVFELTKTLAYRQAPKALKIAANIGSSPKFVMLMTTSALYAYFYKILRLHAALMKNPRLSNGEKAKLLGVSPYFMDEYEATARNYPVKKCMQIVSLLEEYDFRGKGGDGESVPPSELLMELVSKILN